jgi:hypothetical protein
MTLGREGNRNVQNFPRFGPGFILSRPSSHLQNGDHEGLDHKNIQNVWFNDELRLTFS